MLKGKDLMYEKIERYLDELLNTGRLQPGDRLMSERAISSKFKTSSITARKAMQKYIDLGVLEKVHGKGTFVKRLTSAVTTNRIGVMYCFKQDGFFSSPFFTAIMSGIEQEAFTGNKHLVFGPLDPIAPARAFRDLEDNVDGFLMIDIMPNIFPDMERVLKAVAKPLVVLNYEDLGDELDSVVFDSYANAR